MIMRATGWNQTETPARFNSSRNTKNITIGVTKLKLQLKYVHLCCSFLCLTPSVRPDPWKKCSYILPPSKILDMRWQSYQVMTGWPAPDTCWRGIPLVLTLTASSHWAATDQQWPAHTSPHHWVLGWALIGHFTGKNNQASLGLADDGKEVEKEPVGTSAMRRS